MIPPVISPLEYVLGYLWVRQASLGELLGGVARVPSPVLSREGVEAVLRSLIVQGLVVEEGDRLALKKERLHPRARRMAELIAGDLRRAGVLG